MFNQSFSPENFRIILDLESRKGIHVEEKLALLGIKKLNNIIKSCNSSLKLARKTQNWQRVNQLLKLKKEIRVKKEEELKVLLNEISSNVSNNKFRLGIRKVDIPNKKPLFVTEITPENFFASKQVQFNVSKLFGIKQSNRIAIVEQIVTLLSDKLPKYVIRTDVKDFYESITHNILLERINGDNLLSPLSRTIINGILNSYKVLSGSQSGIPRGIGISAFLAELYMRNLDDRIKALNDVEYYARYVDDIVIIFVPKPNKLNNNYLNEVQNIVENDYRLNLNPLKTNTYDLRSNNVQYNLEYLGYNITFGTGETKVRLSNAKIERYKLRIKQSFVEYENLSKVDEKKARKFLVKRIRFLSSNTRLVNNKKNILVGIYYSNRQLNTYEDLIKLDMSLESHINTRIKSQYLIDRLKKYKFQTGFQNKVFFKFTTSELNEIVRIWKYI